MGGATLEEDDHLCGDINSRRSTLAGRLDDDLNVLPKRGQRLHESLQRNALELVIPDRRHFRLRHAEQPCCVDLSEPAVVQDVIDLLSEGRPGREFFCIREPEVDENVARAAILYLAGRVSLAPVDAVTFQDGFQALSFVRIISVQI